MQIIKPRWSAMREQRNPLHYPRRVNANRQKLWITHMGGRNPVSCALCRAKMPLP